METAGPLAELRMALEAEEAVIEELSLLARQLQRALVAADFPAVDATAGAMQGVASRFAALEREREAAVAALGGPERLADLAPAAGWPDLDRARERLAASVDAFRQTQERNAHLVLASSKLIQRMFNAFVGLVEPTYGPGGEAEQGPRRRLFSRGA